MSRHLPLPWIAALSSLAGLTVSAQPALPLSASANHAPQAQAAPYRSTLESYQPFADEKLLPWKQANDTVGKVGGWRAYAKEAHDGAADEAPRGDSATPMPGTADRKGRP